MKALEPELKLSIDLRNAGNGLSRIAAQTIENQYLELRRLAEVNAELLVALQLAEQWIVEARNSCGLKADQTLFDARSAIAKAKEQQ